MTPTNVRKIGRFKARTIKGLTQCGLLIKAWAHYENSRKCEELFFILQALALFLKQRHITTLDDLQSSDRKRVFANLVHTYIASSTHHVISLFLRFLNKKNQFKKYMQTQPPPQDDKNRRNRVSHKKKYLYLVKGDLSLFSSFLVYHYISSNLAQIANDVMDNITNKTLVC